MFVTKIFCALRVAYPAGTGSVWKDSASRPVPCSQLGEECDCRGYSSSRCFNASPARPSHWRNRSPFNAHRKDGERIAVSAYAPAYLLRKLAEEKAVHYAKEASGHRTDRHTWRYVKPNIDMLAADPG
jgi:hypothetical protein